MKVGLVIPLSEDQVTGRALRPAEVIAFARRADAAGVDSLWVWDHLLHRFPDRRVVGFWECWTMLSAIATATETCQIGTLVACAGFRSPALLAKMASTLDELSSGRLVLGLGAGWHRPEFEAFGFPFDHRVDRLGEALEIIVSLLREGRADVRGRYWQAREAELRPRVSRQGGPPVMVAAFGPRMLRLAARYADLWNVDWLGPVERVAERRDAIAGACADVGRDPASLPLSGGLTVAWPDLGPLPEWLRGPDQYLSGSPEALAASLARYGDAGVSHAMCACYPMTDEAIDRLAAAIATYRAGGG